MTTGEILPETCFLSSVVSFDSLPEDLTGGDRLRYGQYDKNNRTLTAILKDLTCGEFKDGAVARILAREFWSRGLAPTLEEYPAAWIHATKEHTRPNPEWAFLSDRANRTAGPDWKRLRARKAEKLLKILDQITPTKKRKLTARLRARRS